MYGNFTYRIADSYKALPYCFITPVRCTHTSFTSTRSIFGMPFAFRFVVCFLMFSATFVGLAHRAIASMTIGAIADENNFSSVGKGIFLASFFIGYICLQIVGGWLARRYGGWAILGGVLALSSLAVLLTPFAAPSLAGLVAIRIATGLGQSALFPTVHELISQWAPRSERSLLVGIVWSGSTAGIAVSLPVSGFLVAAAEHSASIWVGWRAVYYVWGIVGLAIAGIWFALGASSPERHSWAVSDLEREYITSTRDRAGNGQGAIPWAKILLHPAIFAMVVGHICANCELYSLF